jgi:thiol-disulfide isomerase/thioredoxin
LKQLLLLTLLLLAGCAQPDFVDTRGNGYRYADYQGKTMVINYWATWCAPCIKEIPELIALDESHEDIVVFGVNFDAPPPEEAAAQIERMKITFPVYAEDPYPVLGFDQPQVLPTTIIIGPDGEIRSTLVGPQTEETLLEAIRAG